MIEPMEGALCQMNRQLAGVLAADQDLELWTHQQDSGQIMWTIEDRGAPVAAGFAADEDAAVIQMRQEAKVYLLRRSLCP